MRSRIGVLVLDDNPLVLKLARALFEREGCFVSTAANWIELNHALKTSSPEIAFIDVNLPSIKGNRIAEVLGVHSEFCRIPIVLFSDLPEATLEALSRESGAAAWVRKPLTREKIREMIDRLVPAACEAAGEQQSGDYNCAG